MRENIFIELISLLNNGTKNYGISEEVVDNSLSNTVTT